MRKEKQLLLDEVKDKIEDANAFIITRYVGLTAKDATGFRNAVRDTGGEFEVVRKRILLKAASACEVELDASLLEGHIGVVVSGEDPVSTAKAVFKYGKDTKAVEVLGGQLDGVLYGKEEMEKISKLPDMLTMRAQFVGLLQAPMAQTLGVMNSLLTSICILLQNKADKES